MSKKQRFFRNIGIYELVNTPWNRGAVGAFSCFTNTSLCIFVCFSLSNLGLAEIDAKLFEQMVNLQTLNLSKNQLETIPESIALQKLKKLDVSENKLTSIDYVSQFPVLEELFIEGNPLDVSIKTDEI